MVLNGNCSTRDFYKALEALKEGVRKGELILLTAHSGVGKTTMGQTHVPQTTPQPRQDSGSSFTRGSEPDGPTSFQGFGIDSESHKG